MSFRSLPSSRQHALMWGVSALVLLGKALFIFLTPALKLATTIWIIDDAFIEMAVARNIALGNGFTYDFVHATSGSPFLWTYIIALPHLFAGRDLAIQLTLLLSSIFGALSCVVVYFLARHLTGRSAIAWSAFLLSLFSGTAFYNAMNGMDTSSFTLFSLLAIAGALGLWRRFSWPPWVWGGVTGLCAGLAVMTRADGIFVIAPIALLWIIDLFRSSRRSERRTTMQLLSGFLVVAGACLTLYLTWHFLRTGSFVPANQVGRRAISLALHNFSGADATLIHYIRIVLWNFFQLEDLLQIAMGSSVLGFIGCALLLFKPEARRFSALTLLYCATFFGMLAAYQWYFPNFHGLRYVNLSIHLLSIGTAALLWNFPAHRFRTAAVSTMIACLTILSMYLHYQLASRMPWAQYESYIGRPTEEQMTVHWKMTFWIRDNLPKGTVVGIRDHGRTAYFTDLPIQDLAGNIDPKVPAQIAAGTFIPYMQSLDVQYLVLPPPNTRPDPVYKVIFSDMVLDTIPTFLPDANGGLYKINWEKTMKKYNDAHK